MGNVFDKFTCSLNHRCLDELRLDLDCLATCNLNMLWWLKCYFLSEHVLVAEHLHKVGSCPAVPKIAWLWSIPVKLKHLLAQVHCRQLRRNFLQIWVELLLAQIVFHTLVRIQLWFSPNFSGLNSSWRKNIHNFQFNSKIFWG